MTQRYLVTGAQGFIGRHMIAHLLHHFPDCTVLGVGRSPHQDLVFNYSLNCGDHRVPARLPEYLRFPFGPRYRYAALDVTSEDFATAVGVFRPTKVIHFAAALRGTPDDCIFENNVRSTASLLDVVGQCDVEMFLFASSGGVYGKQVSLPIEETAAVLPLDNYSRSKLASEELIGQFAIQSSIPTAMVRIFNVFGPGQDDLHIAGRISGQLAAILVHKAERLVRLGPLSSSRDFLDVRDICYGLALILKSNRQGVYNVGSGVEINVGQLLDVFLDIAGLREDVQIDMDADRIDLVPRHVANIRRLTNEGFVPRYSLEVSCKDMLDYCTRYMRSH